MHRLALSIILRTVTPIVALTAMSTVGCGRAASAADKTHDAVGTIQTIAPNGTYAIISHEDIPGYMPAMTMQFTAGTKEQLAGFTQGDHVAFSFTEKFVLTAIRKR